MNTRKEVQEILENLSQKIDAIITDEGYVVIDPYIAAQAYVFNEENHERCYCSACGRVWDKTRVSARGWYYHRDNSETCPDCGRTLKVVTGQWHSEKKYYFAKLETGFAAIRFSVRYNIAPDMDDVFAWLDQKPEVELAIEDILVFDNDYGYLGKDASGKILAKNSNALESLEYEMRRADFINKADLDIDPSILIKVADAAEEQKTLERQSKKTISKTAQIEEMRQKYVPKKFEFDEVGPEGLIFKQIGQMGNKRTFVCGCMRCGHVETIEGVDRENYTCPVCGVGQEAYSYSSSISKEVISFESTTLPENDLLIRKWNVVKTLEKRPDGTYGITGKIEERLRVFCGKKMLFYSVNNKGELYKERCNSYNVRFYRVETFQDEEDIRIAITNSCLRYAGVAEAYGLGDPVYKKVSDLNSLAYIEAWYKNPAIETLVKSNLVSAVRDAVRSPENVMMEAKNPMEALNISKAVLKIAQKLDLNIGQIREAQRLWTMDNTLTAESFAELRNSQLNVAIVTNIKAEYGIDVADTMKYMQAVYDHQCIEKHEALGIWSDYLRMAKRLNIDLKDKSRRFPSSVKKEHDVAMFAYREIEERVNKEIFQSQAEVNKERYGNYSYKDFFIVVPESPEDVVNEATQQKNCLRSYVNRIKDGETVVVFIRAKEEPDKSYVTVEVHNNKIVQLKGYCNSNPRDKKLMEFVQHWMVAKAITMSC